MFDPTSRIQSAQLHGQDLHHAARHRTHHAADRSLLRRPAPATTSTASTNPVATPVAARSIRRLVPSLRGLGARYLTGRLTHRSAC